MKTSPLEQLRKVYFFRELTDKDLQHLVENAEIRAYPTEAVIVDEGELGLELFIVMSGAVEVTKRLQDIQDLETQHFFGKRVAGDIFGEMALLDDNNIRSARVTALEPTELLVIHQDHFKNLLTTYPDIFMTVVRGLSYRLRESNQITIKDLQQKNKELEELNVSLEKKVIERTAELNKQNRELIDLNKKKDEILSICAHDLRNPLTVIHGFAQLGLIHPMGPEQQREFMEETMQHCENMLKIISSLLDISALEKGQIYLEPTPVDFAGLIRERLQAMANLAKKKSIKLQLQTQSNFPDIIVDRVKLSEVLDNLISNGIKFSYPDTSITVRLSRTNGLAQIQVTDQGQGLSPEDIGRAFQQFQRLSARPTGDETSTGLGLVIVKKLVELHGGQIWIESDGIGKGATFTFTLPIITDLDE